MHLTMGLTGAACNAAGRAWCPAPTSSTQLLFFPMYGLVLLFTVQHKSQRRRVTFQSGWWGGTEPMQGHKTSAEPTANAPSCPSVCHTGNQR